MLTLKVFLSSPGDVAEERRLAVETIRALEDSPLLRERVNLVVIAWDDPVGAAPLDARETPQQSINRWGGRPADCDLTIVVLWSRLGTPLPPSVARADGSRFASGTVWEVEDAIAANRPVFVYRRTDKPRIDLDDADFDQRRAQYEAVRHWFESLRDADGAWRAGINEYATPAGFQRLLRAHLESFIGSRLAALGDPFRAGAAELPPAPIPVTASPRASPRSNGPPPDPRAARRWTLPALAAGVVVLVGLGWALRSGPVPGRTEPPAAVAGVGAAGPAPAPTSPPGTTAAVDAPPSARVAAASAPPAEGGAAAAGAVPRVRLDGPAEARFGAMRPSTYTVLALTPEPGTADRWRLRLRVRLQTAPNSGGMNFWDSSFRLLVDGVPRAPVSNLNELVEGGAAKDGEILFDVPWAVQALALRIAHYQEAAVLPLNVAGTRAPVPLALPAGPRRVALDGPRELAFTKPRRATYTILAVGSEARRPGVFGLRVAARMQVLEPYAANFGDASFRLVVDGVPVAPDSAPNEVVDGQAAKDGEVAFEVPDGARQLVLRVLNGPDETADLPLKLAPKS